jgi:hypothetical protein
VKAASRIERNVELPGSGKDVFYYPGATKGGGVFMDGILVRVSGKNGRWYAMCRAGLFGTEGIFEFESDPSRFVIVHRGAGYCLSYDDPQTWEELPLNGYARYAVAVPDADIVLLFDWIRGVAYGAHGVVWKTPRLFLDDLEVVSCDSRQVTLRGQDLSDPYQIVLDVHDGHFISGQPSRFN